MWASRENAYEPAALALGRVPRRSLDFLLGRISARLDRCVANGFDGVEMDVVDEFSNRTGLAISSDTQLLYNTAPRGHLADERSA
jgi:hypothetical protein